jgi:hypothetical protein
MPTRQRAARGWTGLVLALATLAVLAPPALLFWNTLQPEPWNSRTVRIRFQTIRYEAGGLVFRYSVQNLTHHAARFLPNATQIRALQPAGRPPVGYANVKLPLELPAGALKEVDLRLELPGTPQSLWREQSDEQTKRVLRQKTPGSDSDSPGSPLPMLGALPGRENPPEPRDDFSLEDSLTDFQGFELTDPARGILLIFPRGW